MSHLSRYDDEFLSNGDLREEYLEIAQRRGRLSAKIWYWMQVLYALLSNVKHRIVWSLTMFWNYMKIALRNFKKQKVYSLINVFGLAIGLLCSLLIFLWIQDELSYDRYYDNADSLYRVVDYSIMPSGERQYSAPTPPILGKYLKEEYPEVTHATRLFTPANSLGTDERRFIEDVAMVDADFLKMFDIHFLQGNAESAFPDINSVVITTELAEKLFGGKDPMGEVISMEGRIDLTIRGVIEEFPENFHLYYYDFKACVPIQILDAWGRSTENWGDHSFKTYIQFRPEADPIEFESKIVDLYQAHTSDRKEKLFLQSITKIHLYDLGGGGLITYVYILSGMAVFMLIIACINYMNLSTARSMKRAMEVGLRRVVGAERRQLIRQFLGESVFLTLIAMGIAFLLGFALMPWFNRLVEKDLGFSFSWSFIIMVFTVILITGLLAGSYPAFFLSRFRAVDVLKGKDSGMSGRGFRRVLVVFQFSLSILLLIGTGIIFNQVRFIRNRPLGYEPENIVCITMTSGIYDHYESIRAELLQSPGVLSLSKVNTTLDSWESSATFERLRWDEKEPFHDQTRLAVMGADEDFLGTFSLEMVEGRFFNREHTSDRQTSIVLNETAVRIMGITNPLESAVYSSETQLSIIGVMKDFHYSSLHDAIEPLVVLFNWGIDNVALRISSENIPATLATIEETIRRFVPGYTLEYDFLDDRLDRMYRAESQMESLAVVMTILAGIISCFGLLGLASFSAEQKTKEIGVRKILGSSVPEIIVLLVKEFSRWVLLANMFAWPAAYFAGKQWLENYAYRAPMQISIFIIAGVGTLILAILTVSYQSVKAARANPVDSLRYE